jgi:hypothetical protein
MLQERRVTTRQISPSGMHPVGDQHLFVEEDSNDHDNDCHLE